MQADTLVQNHVHTIVIGGGQAGLAVGYFLQARGDDFVILDGAEQVGDAWRKRWQSLRLFTPAQHDGLPGMPFPGTRGDCPTKDAFADYLARYAAHFGLPVRSGVRVTGLTRTPAGFVVDTATGQLTAARVVLATGTNPHPWTPPFADDLSPAIHQLHTSDYTGPADIPAGPVLVVGAGTSGVQIAIELAATHPTSIAGRPTTHIPDLLLRVAGGPYWWFISNVLTTATPMGRKARPKVRGGGGPLISVSVKDLAAAGVTRLPRVAGVRDGCPLLEGDSTVDVATVVWATGFRPDFSWIGLDVTDDSGWPAGARGVSSKAPGLYFVGMPFQYGLTSGLIGGVGRDAAYVADHLLDTRPEAAPSPASAA
jgi:putative flavoprotein involved in K+ transport